MPSYASKIFMSPPWSRSASPRRAAAPSAPARIFHT
jgi:hypothetical protein